MKFCSHADKKNTVLPTSIAQKKTAGNDKKWVPAVKYRQPPMFLHAVGPLHDLPTCSAKKD